MTMLNRSSFLFLTASSIALMSLCVTALTTNKASDHHDKEEAYYGRRYDFPSLRSREKLASYSDTFPSRFEIKDLVQLAGRDIYDIDKEQGKVDSSKIKDTKWKFKLWVEAEVSTEGMILQDRQSTVVAFRGSEDVDDWIKNAEFNQATSKFQGAPSSNVKVHQGFQDSITRRNQINVYGGICEPFCTKLEEGKNSVIERIEQEVVSLIGPNGELHVGGHSLGGALAHYFGVWMADRYPKMKVKVITIGQPRLGNNAFKKWTENKLQNLAVWRVVYERDIVPRIPDNYGLDRYANVGHLYQIKKRDGTKAYYHQDGDGSYYKGVNADDPTWSYGNSMFDHLGFRYVRFCADNINKIEFWATGFETIWRGENANEVGTSTVE